MKDGQKDVRDRLAVIISNEIAHAAREMGDTWQDVQSFLVAKGVKGRRGRGDHCPVAIYLGKRFGLCRTYPDWIEHMFTGAEAPTTPALKEWMDRFGRMDLGEGGYQAVRADNLYKHLPGDRAGRSKLHSNALSGWGGRKAS